MNNIDELIKRLPRKKSLLEMACYQGCGFTEKVDSGNGGILQRIQQMP